MIVNFLPDSSPPAGELNEGRYCDIMKLTSQYLWVATDGKHWIRQVRFFRGVVDADVQWSVVDDSGYSFGYFLDRIEMNEIKGRAEDRVAWLLAHEIGHFLYGLEDEYRRVNSGLGMCSDFHDDCAGVADLFRCDSDDDCVGLGDTCIVRTIASGSNVYHCSGALPGRDCSTDAECFVVGIDPQDTCDLVESSSCVAPGTSADPGQKKICRPDGSLSKDSSEGPKQWACAMANLYPRTRWCDGSSHLDELSEAIGGTDRIFDNPTSQTYNCWARAASNQRDLEDHHKAGQYPSANSLGAPPEPTECQWLISPVNPGEHTVFLVDRSGSMAYEDATETPAIELVEDAALHFYNETPEGTWAGVISFAEEPKQEIPFEERSNNETSLALTADGLTDLCQAIDEARATIESSEAPLSTRHVLLFSDGRQTEGCDPYAAARRACDAGITVNTISYGNADSAALQQLAQIGCNGFSRVTGVASTDASEPDPHELKTALAMSRYEILGEDNLMEERRSLSSGTIDSEAFRVPAGTRTLKFAWLGNRVADFVPPAVVTSRESVSKQFVFPDLTFSLRDPGGTVYPSDPDDAEVDGHYATVTVDDPDPGIWTARINLENVADALRQQVRIGWLAYADHPIYRARSWVPFPRQPTDAPVAIQAQLVYGEPLGGIVVNATVSHRGQDWHLRLFDDGRHGDEGAGDAIYGAIFNAQRNQLEPGGYRVKVRLRATGESQPVPGDGEDDAVLFGVNPPIGTFEAETSFLLSDRYSLGPTGRPSPGAVSVSCPTLPFGTTKTGLEARVTGLRVDPSTTRLSFGPGVELTNLEFECLNCGDLTQPPESVIRFDATVGSGARRGPQSLVAQVGGEVLRSEGSCLVDAEDCNENGVLDSMDIGMGFSLDLNTNGVPDECERSRLIWIFSGTAQGGQIDATIEGVNAPCMLSVVTTAGESAAIVAANLAQAINTDACLADQGITATTDGSRLILTGVELDQGDVTETISDPGLSHEADLSSIPDLRRPGQVLMILLLLGAGVAVLRRSLF